MVIGFSFLKTIKRLLLEVLDTRSKGNAEVVAAYMGGLIHKWPRGIVGIIQQPIYRRR